MLTTGARRRVSGRVALVRGRFEFWVFPPLLHHVTFLHPLVVPQGGVKDLPSVWLQYFQTYAKLLQVQRALYTLRSESSWMHPESGDIRLAIQRGDRQPGQ